MNNDFRPPGQDHFTRPDQRASIEAISTPLTTTESGSLYPSRSGSLWPSLDTEVSLNR